MDGHSQDQGLIPFKDHAQTAGRVIQYGATGVFAVGVRKGSPRRFTPVAKEARE
jgi:hypothetical protein